jgi:hypothetical protein
MVDYRDKEQGFLTFFLNKQAVSNRMPITGTWYESQSHWIVTSSKTLTTTMLPLRAQVPVRWPLPPAPRHTDRGAAAGARRVLAARGGAS